MADVSMASGRAAAAGVAPGRLELVRAFVNTRDIEAGTDALSTPAGLDRWLAAHGLAGRDQPDGPAGRDQPDGLAGRDRPDRPAGLAGRDRPDGPDWPYGRGRRGDRPGPGGAAAPPPAATDADLERALALRECLRAVLRAHARTGAAGAGDAAQALGLAGDARGADAGGADEVSGLRVVAGGLKARLAVGAGGTVTAVPDGAGAAAGLAGILLAAAEAAILGTWPRLKACCADDCQWAFYDRSPTRSGHWCSMAVCGSRAKSRAYRQRAAVTQARRVPAAEGGAGA